MEQIVRWWNKQNEVSSSVYTSSWRKTRYIIPFYVLLQLFLYLLFKDSLTDMGFWVIITPSIILILILLNIRWQERNIPGTYGYYLFHLSHISILIIVVAAILLFGLYLYRQCTEYYLPVNNACLEKIF